VNIYFRSYTSIANQEKDGLEYGQLSATDQKIVDQMRERQSITANSAPRFAASPVIVETRQGVD